MLMPTLITLRSTQNYAENLEALTLTKTSFCVSICPALILVESGFPADSTHWELFMEVSLFCWLIFKLCTSCLHFDTLFFFFPSRRACLSLYSASYRGEKRKQHYHLRFFFIIIKTLSHLIKLKLSLKTSDKTKGTCAVLKRVVPITWQRNWMFLNRE